jgi:hypothetical protein
MSWRNVVKLIAKHGPMTANQAQLRTEGDARAYIRAACRYGLLVAPGRQGRLHGGAEWVYRLSPLGVLWVEGRAAYCTAQQTRPRTRQGKCIRPSWLASLPLGNEIRLGAA